LIDNPLLVDDKRVNNRLSIRHGPRDGTEARDHIVVDYVVELATGYVGALASEDSVS
jgi:hypothetical protein